MSIESNSSTNKKEEKAVTWEVWCEKYRERFQKLSLAQKRYVNNELIKRSLHYRSHQS